MCHIDGDEHNVVVEREDATLEAGGPDHEQSKHQPQQHARNVGTQVHTKRTRPRSELTEGV